MPVLGPLLTRGDWLTSLLGATDYGTLGRTLEAAFADPSARAVLLELDSPGGEVGGLFDLVDRIGALRESSGKPLWAVAGEAALSAAYAIASAADRLYVTRTAEIGSIGIVAAHVDESGADAMAGRKWTLVHAGARKTDGNPHEPLSDRALATIQADVDALHAELCALVARNRRMTPEAVRATEAAIWRGKAGIAAGFADRLGTLDQALADLAASLDPPPGRCRPALHHPTDAGNQHDRTDPDRDRRAARRHRSARRHRAGNAARNAAGPDSAGRCSGPAAVTHFGRRRAAPRRVRRDRRRRGAGGPARHHRRRRRCHEARRRPGGAAPLGARRARHPRRGQRRRLRRAAADRRRPCGEPHREARPRARRRHPHLRS